MTKDEQNRVYKGLHGSLTDENSVAWEMQPSPIGPNQNILFGSRKCLPYGAQSEDAWSPPRKSLEPNQLYKVELKLALYNNTIAENTSYVGVEERDYKGYFCLFREKNGGKKVHEVPYNEQKKEWDFEICDRLSEEQYEE
jgi:hypothetical protein